MGLQPLGTPSAPNKTRPVPYWPVRHQVFRWRSSKTSEHINLLIYGTAHHDRANRRLQCSTWASCRDRVATAGRDVARAERADARAWPRVEVRYYFIDVVCQCPDASSSSWPTLLSTSPKESARVRPPTRFHGVSVDAVKPFCSTDLDIQSCYSG